MSDSFWLEKWEKGDTKFDQTEVNPYLIRHKEIFGDLKGKKIFVPLCGKSIDLLWFLNQGAEVIGVELSSIAIEAFLTENNLTYNKFNQRSFTVYQAKFLTFICGDFFQLGKEDIGDIDWIYDRASLIALDGNIRVKYANKLIQLSSAMSRVFLISLSYTHETSPNRPPYSVTSAEINVLFSKYFQVNILSQYENLDIMPHLVQRGLVDLRDDVYLLNRAKDSVIKQSL